YPAPAYNDTFTFSSPPAIGARGDNFGNSFLGLVDEVSVYNRPLTTSEVATIYNAGSAGKCGTGVAPSIVTQPQGMAVNAGASVTLSVTASGTPPLSYQWRKNGNDILNATSTASTILTVQTYDAGNSAVP